MTEAVAERSAGAQPLTSLARGSLWALGGYATGQALRLGGNMILWRLLDPQSFGMMAIASVFIQGLWMFSDMGIGPSIVQHERGDDRDYLNTAWTIQLVRGLILYTAASLLALPLAHFYDEPMLAGVIPVAGLGLFLSAFNSTGFHSVRRHMALGRLTAIELVSQAIGVAATVTWALIVPSIWALAGGGIATHASRLVLGLLFLPNSKNWFRWEPEAAKDLLAFGRWVMFSSVLGFTAAQADRLIFGKLVPLEELGVYSVAAVWAGLPNDVLSQILGMVLFPLLSKLRQQGASFPDAFRRARFPVLLAAGWMSTCLAAGGPALIRFLYDDRAHDAQWIVQILAIGTWLLALARANDAVFLAQGGPKWVAAGNAGKLVGMVLIIPLGAVLFGFRGAVIGFAVSELVRYVVSWAGLARLKLRVWTQDIVLSAAAVAATLLGILVSLAVRHSFVESTRWTVFAEGLAVFLVVSGVWGAMYLWHRAAKPATAS